MQSSASKQIGFTLLEVILVILLFGLLVSAVVVNFSWDNRDDKLEQEAHRFQQLFHYAAETALMRQQEWGVVIKPNGYEFMVYQPDDDQWLPVDTPASMAWHELAIGQELRLELDGLPWQEDSLLGALNWHTDALDDQQRQADDIAVLPHIFILSSGEITPFQLIVQDESERPFWYVEVRGEFSIPLRRSAIAGNPP